MGRLIMTRISKDAKGYWYMDGEKINVGDGKIEWDEGPLEHVLFTGSDITIVNPNSGEEIRGTGDMKITVRKDLPLALPCSQEPVDVRIDFTHQDGHHEQTSFDITPNPEPDDV
jgi:hypothetical protein